jgi:hypothetical protein
MASLILGSIGSSLLGPIGGFLGSMLGSYIDQLLFAPKPQDVEGPRLDDLSTTRADVGVPIPLVYGADRVSGNIICSSEIIEVKKTKKVGSKGAKQKVTTYTYYIDMDVLLCEGPIIGVARIWADGKLIRGLRDSIVIDTEANAGKVGAFPYPDRYKAAMYDPKKVPWTLDPAGQSDGNYYLYNGVSFDVASAGEASDAEAKGRIVYWRDPVTDYYFPTPSSVAYNGSTVEVDNDYEYDHPALVITPITSSTDQEVVALNGPVVTNGQTVAYLNSFDAWSYISDAPGGALDASIDPLTHTLRFDRIYGSSWLIRDYDISETGLGIPNEVLDRGDTAYVSLKIYFADNGSSASYEVYVQCLGVYNYDYFEDTWDATIASEINFSTPHTFKVDRAKVPSGTRTLRVAIRKKMPGYVNLRDTDMYFPEGIIIDWTVSDSDSESVQNNALDQPSYYDVLAALDKQNAIIAQTGENGEIVYNDILGLMFNPTFTYNPSPSVRGWTDYYNLFAALNDWSPKSIFSYDKSNGITLYRGTSDQAQDPLMSEVVGGEVPAYKNRAHIVFDHMALADFGSRPPNLTFEVVRYENDRIGTVLVDFMTRATLEEKHYDISELPTEGIESYVAGYSVGNSTSYRAAMETLLSAFRIDAAEINDKIVFRPYARAADHAIPYDDLGATEAGSGTKDIVQLVYGDPLEMPKSVEAVFSDPGREYQANTAKYSRQVSKALNKASTQVAIVSYPHVMRMWAQNMLRQAWGERITAKFSLPHRDIYISPTDVVTFNKGEGVVDYATSSKEITPNIDVVILPGLAPDPNVSRYSTSVPLSIGNFTAGNGLFTNVYLSEQDGVPYIIETGLSNDYAIWQDFDLLALGVPQEAIDNGNVYVSFKLGVRDLSAFVTASTFVVGIGENEDGSPQLGEIYNHFAATNVIYGDTSEFKYGTVGGQLRPNDRWVRCLWRIQRAAAILGGSAYTGIELVVSYKYDPQMVYEGFTVKVSEVTRGANGILEISGSVIDPPAHTRDVVDFTSLSAGGSTYLSSGVDNRVSPTKFIGLNLPPLLGNDNDAGFYAAVSGTSNAWGGCDVERSLSGGASYDNLASTSVSTVIGRIISGTLLPSPDCALPDMYSDITVELYNKDDTLQSITADELFASGNAALIGKEIVSFMLADYLGNNRYRLHGGMLRGQLDTDRPEITDTHVTGEDFVLLSDLSMLSIDDELVRKDVSIPFKAITYDSTEAMTPVTYFTNECERLTPFSPIHLTGSRNGGGDLTISWTRQDRLFRGFVDNSDIGMSEASEKYEIDIILEVGGVDTPVRTLEVVGATQVVYTSAEQSADGISPGDPVTVRAYQISTIVGRGNSKKGIV